MGFICGIIKHLLLGILTIILLTGCSRRENELFDSYFDDGWKFCLGENRGFENPLFSDSAWRDIVLPHDWMIEDKPGTKSPFVPEVKDGVSSGFMVGDVACYRKSFNGIEPDKVYYLCFDGVYMNADLWINGTFISNHYYGYTPFFFDVTENLQSDTTNILAMRVNTPVVTSRWYSGAGIYRHVRLLKKEINHILPFSLHITSDIVADKATVSIDYIMKGDSTSQVEFIIEDSKGKNVACCKAVGNDIKIEVVNPHLWDIDNPYLYTLVTLVDGKIDNTQTFGIRKIEFIPNEGFYLNGKKLLLKGGCIHHDNGALGAMAFEDAEERKIRLLKEAGFNMLRMAHNPPSSTFLDACDRLGMLVIDEAFDVWNTPTFDNDYACHFDKDWRNDVKSFIDRDFNHPSVIMWSSGNEIAHGDQDEVADISAQMTAFIHSLDDSRPVTNAVNDVSHSKDKLLSTLDVAGYNYSRGVYEEGHNTRPDQLIYASESYAPQAFDYWNDVKQYPFIIGDCVWTAFDYLGESSIGWYGYYLKDNYFPWHVAYCGDIDLCGDRRPQSYYRQILWQDEPRCYITAVPPESTFPKNPEKEYWSVWDWPDEVRNWSFDGFEKYPVDIVVYSNCDSVELFLNGKSLGTCCNDHHNRFKWTAQYEAGRLDAVGFSGDTIVCSDSLETSNTATSVSIVTNVKRLRPNHRDLAFIDISFIDQNGRVDTSFDEEVKVTVSGAAELMALTNGNPMDVTGFQHDTKFAWHGKCLAIIRTTNQSGDIRLTVRSTGGLTSQIQLQSKSKCKRFLFY